MIVELNEIEYKIATGELNASQVFTQMKQHIDPTSKTIHDDMQGFTNKIQEINRLEKVNSELYLFCSNACEEIFKHTGSHEWREKLKSMNL